MSNLRSFAAPAGTTYGNSLDNTAVTTQAAFTAAIAALRSPAGHTPSASASWLNPPRWSAFDAMMANTQTTAGGASMATEVAALQVPTGGPSQKKSNALCDASVSPRPPDTPLRCAQAANIEPLLVFWLGCNAFSFSTLDSTNATYWEEHWCAKGSDEAPDRPTGHHEGDPGRRCRTILTWAAPDLLEWKLLLATAPFSSFTDWLILQGAVQAPVHGCPLGIHKGCQEVGVLVRLSRSSLLLTEAGGGARWGLLNGDTHLCFCSSDLPCPRRVACFRRNEPDLNSPCITQYSWVEHYTLQTQASAPRSVSHD